jgi:hypothetical protein
MQLAFPGEQKAKCTKFFLRDYFLNAIDCPSLKIKCLELNQATLDETFVIVTRLESFQSLEVLKNVRQRLKKGTGCC